MPDGGGGNGSHMKRLLLQFILSHWFTRILLTAAVLLVVLSVCLTHTMHVYTFHHLTLIQFGDTFTLGNGGNVYIRPTRIWAVALVLAVPAMAWTVWFAGMLDGKARR